MALNINNIYNHFFIVDISRDFAVHRLLTVYCSLYNRIYIDCKQNYLFFFYTVLVCALFQCFFLVIIIGLLLSDYLGFIYFLLLLNATSFFRCRKNVIKECSKISITCLLWEIKVEIDWAKHCVMMPQLSVKHLFDMFDWAI